MALTLKRLRLLMSAVTAVFLLTAIGIVTWTLQTTATIPPTGPKLTVGKRSLAENSFTLSESPTATDFEPYFEVRLQRRLFDPPAPKPAPVVAPPPPPPPNVKLLATMIEGESSQAMFSDSSGATSFRSVGDTIGEGNSSAEIIEITDKAVVIRHFGELVTLSLGTN